MNTDSPPAPNKAERAVTALIQHSNTWGPPWFGLIFIGSVLNAVARDVWPEGNNLLIALASAGIGLGAGLVAKHRGVWL